MNEQTNDDSLLLCASDLQHAAIYDNYTELRECVQAVAKRITALSHPKSVEADSGVIAAPVAGAHPAKGTSAHPFPARIMDQLQEIARREDSEHHGPWTDGDGEPLQDDADAAIAWIKAAAPVVPAPVAVNFQQRVQPWMLACFGEVIAADREERNHRFLEEALELVQSTSCTAHEAHQLVDYVYGRPVGESAQEVGGVMVTLAALCLANGLDMHDAAEVELARIWTKVEAIRAKQAAKPKHSPLPQAAPVAQLSEPPEGWKLIPIEPTEKMRNAACGAWLDCGSKMLLNKAYAAVKAAIAAAPLLQRN